MENNLTEKKRKKTILPVILSLVVIASAMFGITRYTYSLHHEDTDDAQVDADISPVLARVGGYVEKINFEDAQHVNKGDTLIILDDRDLRIKFIQAEAAVENAKAAVSVSQSNISSAQAARQTAVSNIDAAKVRVWKATQDYNRYSNLLNDHAITQQQFDAVRAEKESSEAQLNAINKQETVAAAQSESTSKQVTVAQSIVAQREADLDYAKLQLSYAAVIAPATGFVSKKNVQNGQLVNPGSPLFSIVSDSVIYVTANFKETQLERMEKGQEVIVKADAFPKEELHATINSFSAATGAKFSLLPPDNATGNFVKVVQRIPIKISFTDKTPFIQKLRPGMSVKVSVKIN